MTFATWLNSLNEKIKSLTEQISDYFSVFYSTENIFVNEVEFTPTTIEIPKTKKEYYTDYRYTSKNIYTHTYNWRTNSYSYEYKPTLVRESYTNTRHVPNGSDKYNGSHVIINKNSENPYHINYIFYWEKDLFTPNQTLHITKICNSPMIINGHFLLYNSIGVCLIGCSLLALAPFY